MTPRESDESGVRDDEVLAPATPGAEALPSEHPNPAEEEDDQSRDRGD